MQPRSLRSRLLGTLLAGGLRISPALTAAGAVSLPGCQLHAVSPSLPAAATAPAFTLASTGGTLDSTAALSRGPLVLVFYRGHW